MHRPTSRTTRRSALAVLAAATVALAFPTSAQNSAPLKIGFVYVSPVGDAGWTHQHDIARLAMEKNLAGKVTTKFVENVPEGADAERVIRDLAQFQAQAAGVAIPSQLLAMLPYLATIVVLALISRDAGLIRLNAPASLGRPFHPEA